MGDSRKKQAARLKGAELALLGLDKPLVLPEGARTSRQLAGGDAQLAGDKDIARLCESALRHADRVDRFTHGFHSYPAAMHPLAVRDLLGLGAGAVLDPFCGGGTVAIEARADGRDTLACDLGAVPCLVARARLAVTDEAARTAMRSRAREVAELAIRATPGDAPDDAPPEIRRAYKPHVAAELNVIRRGIGNDPLLRAVFSAILVKVSLRTSDTRMAQTDTERPEGTTTTLFHKKARELGRLLETTEPHTAHARVHREDARELRETGFGLVITSPPYPGVYDYAPIQSLRRWWLGLDDAATLRTEMGSRRAFRADRAEALVEWKADTAKWLTRAYKALETGGRLAVVVGDGQVGEKRIDSWTVHDEGARAAGFRWVARASVERLDGGFNARRWEHIGVWER